MTRGGRRMPAPTSSAPRTPGRIVPGSRSRPTGSATSLLCGSTSTRPRRPWIATRRYATQAPRTRMQSTRSTSRDRRSARPSTRRSKPCRQRSTRAKWAPRSNGEPTEGAGGAGYRGAGAGALLLLRARRLNARRLARHLREVGRIGRLALARCLLAVDPLEQRPQVADGIVHRGLHVAEPGEALAHRRDREVLRLDIRELVPGDRRRDRRVRSRPHGVGRGDRPVARVLVVVDEHLLAALLLPPGGRDGVRQPALDLARERERAAAHDAEAPVGLDPAEHVDPAVARRLRPAD